MLKENSASYLITTNHKIDFMKSDICENVLSDHHDLVYSSLRKPFATGKSKTLIKFIDEEYLLVYWYLLICPLKYFSKYIQSILNIFTPYKQRKNGITTAILWLSNLGRKLCQKLW